MSLDVDNEDRAATDELLRLLRTWQAPAVSPALKNRIIARLAAPERSSWWPVTARAQFAIFAAGLILGIAVGLAAPIPHNVIDSAKMIAMMW
jgi:hypothetical protein